MNIELELKDLLRRREPPPGFAEQVMARVLVDSRPPLSGQPRAAVIHRGWRALAAAALMAITLGGWGVHVTLRARDELRLAMRITAEKVGRAQQQVRAVSR